MPATRSSGARVVLGGERVVEGLAQGAAGGADLLVGVARSHLEREVEAGVLGHHDEQVVEDRQPGRDVRCARPLDDEARDPLLLGTH